MQRTISRRSSEKYFFCFYGSILAGFSESGGRGVKLFLSRGGERNFTEVEEGLKKG